jgi:hypothetical protein
MSDARVPAAQNRNEEQTEMPRDDWASSGRSSFAAAKMCPAGTPTIKLKPTSQEKTPSLWKTPSRRTESLWIQF